jgi:predicted DNA-binding helix-hairpin-helix protein
MHPAIQSPPDLHTRLDMLGGTARFEAIGPVYCGGPEICQAGAIYHATSCGGRSMPLLKVLLDNHCAGTCGYCAFRGARDQPRTRLWPEELARAFDALHRQGRVEGLFLSSGLWPDPVTAMSRQVEAAEILRKTYNFHGYIHLKVLPGCEYAQIEHAARLGSRLSLNLDAPSRARIGVLAPSKSHPELLRRHLADLDRLSTAGLLPSGAWTTQFVVGPAGESDQELLSTSHALYARHHLRRAYYSRFEPIPDTPLEAAPATSRRRQRRLYEADALLRSYGFSAHELVFGGGGGLDADLDPKEAWARAHPELFPLDLEGAEPAELLRVPGIGPVSLGRILRARREGALLRDTDLKALGLQAARCAPFLSLGGRRLASELPPRQLSLFTTIG